MNSRLRNSVQLFGSASVIFGLAVGGYHYPLAVLPFGVYVAAAIGLVIYENSKRKEDQDRR